MTKDTGHFILAALATVGAVVLFALNKDEGAALLIAAIVGQAGGAVVERTGK